MQAAHQLAVLYDAGEGVPADALTAASLYASAASHNVRIAQANLALVYERGIVEGYMPATLDIAWQWFTRSMEAREHVEDEEGIADSHAAFVEYLGSAEALKRYGGQAHYLRGMAYAKGLGVSVDVEAAVSCF
jgi:TPR repeat protein